MPRKNRFDLAELPAVHGSMKRRGNSEFVYYKHLADISSMRLFSMGKVVRFLSFSRMYIALSHLEELLCCCVRAYIDDGKNCVLRCNEAVLEVEGR